MLDRKKYTAILAREFRKAAGVVPNHPIKVVFTNKETINVYIKLAGRHLRYEMSIGSDDDEFWFNAVDARGNPVPKTLPIAFAFPEDWLALEESQLKPRKGRSRK